MRSSTLCLVAMLAGCGAVKDSDRPHADAGAGFLPAACVDLGMTAANTDVQLHLDGDVAKPYAAHCGADLKTYLMLQGSNTSSYPAGGCGTIQTGSNTATSVVTTWHMVQLDPVKHAIATNDYTFAVSTGTTHEESDNGNYKHDYLAMPFASGRSCVSGMAQTVATVDLSGSHFAITASQIWAANGFNAIVAPTVNTARTTATIVATGFPIGATPCPGVSDYYTTDGGACLGLDYVP